MQIYGKQKKYIFPREMFARPVRVSLSTLLYKLRYKSRSVLHNGTWDRKIEKNPGILICRLQLR